LTDEETKNRLRKLISSFSDAAFVVLEHEQVDALKPSVTTSPPLIRATTMMRQLTIVTGADAVSLPMRRLTPPALPAHDLDYELNNALANNPILEYAGHRLCPSVRELFSYVFGTG
jgi:hypothetical protein